MRISILSLAAVLASSGLAAAHYDGSEQWHDIGTDLGFLEDSPLGPMIPEQGATGVCWYSESEFPVDLFNGPPHTHLGDILGHSYGAGVGQDCDGMVGGPACSEGAQNPSVFVLVGTTDAFPLVAFCHGEDASGLPGAPGLPTLPPEGVPPEGIPPPLPPVGPLPEPLECIASAPTVEGIQACLGPLPVPETPEVPPEVQCVVDAGQDPAAIQACLGPLPVPETPEVPEVPGVPEVPEVPPQVQCIVDANGDGPAILVCVGAPEAPLPTPAEVCAALPPDVQAAVPACAEP